VGITLLGLAYPLPALVLNGGLLSFRREADEKGWGGSRAECCCPLDGVLIEYRPPSTRLKLFLLLESSLQCADMDRLWQGAMQLAGTISNTHPLSLLYGDQPP
jgi:hypothetical protein